MSTSPDLSRLSKPTGRDRIPETTLAYVKARNRRVVFGVIQKEFEKAGVQNADLIARLKKDPATISRLLSAPSNAELDTISEVIFATTGGVISSIEIRYPFGVADSVTVQKHLQNPAVSTSSGGFGSEWNWKPRKPTVNPVLETEAIKELV